MGKLMERRCAECGRQLFLYYYKVTDNFLQFKYFDADEDNCFCSAECLAKYVMLEQFEVEEEK